MNWRGGLVGGLVAFAWAGASSALLLMAVWGWSLDAPVPGWTAFVGAVYGGVCGGAGAAVGLRWRR